ncbi:hypothetical protein TSUD_138860 [Trifolium subterraneum]|uniref:Uncharacterized protein n=1 Tax=Trifolium subterraneum TaxID=3900 RepID=A0A2Z6NTE6_TRISU|nr:hypothetical protein TSUD_138860 [Trifolium subterraneum]
MGSCSSVQRKNNKDNNNNMKLKNGFFGSKTEKIVIPQSPIKEQPKNGTFKWSPSQSTTNFTDFGSKEETFFDSKAWIDSDCEDDFYSVNGGKHFWLFNKPSCSSSESSPDKGKKLLELFKDSVKDNNQDDDAKEKKQVKPTIQDVLPKSSNSTPCRSAANSACSSERITSADRASVKDQKSPKSSVFCFPSLTSCRSFRERRSKTSPAIAVDGKV